MSAFLDLALVMSLLTGGALALRSLPWTDSEIERVHLAALGLQVGITDLGLDDAGCCVLSFDSTVVNFEADEETHRLFLYADVGTPKAGVRLLRWMPFWGAPEALAFGAAQAAALMAKAASSPPEFRPMTWNKSVLPLRRVRAP